MEFSGGYTCSLCGAWVWNNSLHLCQSQRYQSCISVCLSCPLKEKCANYNPGCFKAKPDDPIGVATLKESGAVGYEADFSGIASMVNGDKISVNHVTGNVRIGKAWVIGNDLFKTESDEPEEVSHEVSKL